MRKTKIVATLGPKSFDLVPSMIAAGVDVFRFNASHMHLPRDFWFFEKIVRKIRRASEILERQTEVMVDAPGHKFRLGDFPARELKEGAELVLTLDQPTNGEILFPYENYLLSLRPGHEILIGDGSFRLSVAKAATAGLSTVTCQVTLGGLLEPRKGFLARGLAVSGLGLSALTDADKESLKFAVRVGAEQVVMSYGTSAAQMSSFMDYYKELGGVGSAWFKYELAEAASDLAAIAEVSDAGFVGQGDLSLSVPSETVPAEAKKVVEAFVRLGKPCIVGTELLASMKERPYPTNGERAGIYYNVGIHATGLMVSDETAAGKHPVEVVRSLHQIIEAAEECLL